MHFGKTSRSYGPRRLLAAALAGAFLVSGCATLPPEEDPLQIRLNDLDARLGRLERVVNNQSLMELSQRIDALQAEVRSLRGQGEETENAMQSVRRQQRDLYADLDRRIAALEGRGAAVVTDASAGPEAASAPAANGADAAPQAYGRAFDALKQSRYAEAIAGFEAFLRSWPTHDLADNAQYWLGEAHYVNRDYDKAIAAFADVGAKWPDSAKAGDALLKLGYAQLELRRTAEGRRTLQDVVAKFPGTDAARLAAERLRRLPAGG
jgi:tol-pal system protein YbgF